MKTLKTLLIIGIIAAIIPSITIAQQLSRVDTFKIFVKDTTFIQTVVNISDDSVLTYEIKPAIRKDGVYRIFSDNAFSKLIFQTEFRENNKVGYDTYWYPNRNKSMCFKAKETVCTDSINNTVSACRLTKRVGLYLAWYKDGKLKASGSYILINNCSDVKIGTWTYWATNGQKQEIIYKFDEH